MSVRQVTYEPRPVMRLTVQHFTLAFKIHIGTLGIISHVFIILRREMIRAFFLGIGLACPSGWLG